MFCIVMCIVSNAAPIYILGHFYDYSSAFLQESQRKVQLLMKNCLFSMQVPKVEENEIH